MYLIKIILINLNLVDDASSVLKASIIGDKNLNDEQLKKKGFSIETLLVSCQFNKDKCGPADFKWTHTYEYGNCYTFNDPFINSNSKATSKPAPANGLTLELFLGISGNNDFYTIKRGVHVFVHERGYLPLFNNEGIDVMASTASNIAISRTKYSKYDPPYSSCKRDVATILSTDSDLYKKTLSVSSYTQKLCFELCLQHLFIIPTCSCSDPCKFINLLIKSVIFFSLNFVCPYSS